MNQNGCGRFQYQVSCECKTVKVNLSMHFLSVQFVIDGENTI